MLVRLQQPPPWPGHVSCVLQRHKPVVSLQLRKLRLCGLSHSHTLSRIRSWGAQIINNPSLQRTLQYSLRLSLFPGLQLIVDLEIVLGANWTLMELINLMSSLRPLHQAFKFYSTVLFSYREQTSEHQDLA